MGIGEELGRGQAGCPTGPPCQRAVSCAFCAGGNAHGRYPTFTLALQDLQDPLNLVHLFSTLPTNPIPGKTLVPSEVIGECSRLIAEWKVSRYIP